MYSEREPLTYTLCRLTGKHYRGLPDIQAYTNHIRYRDEEIRQNLREKDRFVIVSRSSLAVVYKCESKGDCGAVVCDESYSLCGPHNELRQELKYAYQLINPNPPIQALTSLVCFREIQLRQIYLERYNLRPNWKHEDWILYLLDNISWQEVSKMGELQRDAYVHRALNRSHYRGPSQSFQYHRINMCRACACPRCVFKSPYEEFGKYF